EAILRLSSIPPAYDQRLVLRQTLRRAHLREFGDHYLGALALALRYQWHPPDFDPLVDIRPRDRERRRPFLDPQTRLRERLLVADPRTRIGFAPLRPPKNHLAKFAPSLRTDDRAERLPHAVVALPRRYQHSSRLHAARKLGHDALDVRDELQHVAREDEIERLRLERQPRGVRAKQPAFRACSIARRQEHLE